MEQSYVSSVLRATAADGMLRCYSAITTGIVEEARKRHGFYPVVSAAVGRTMTAAAIMGAMLADDQRVMAEIVGDGPVGRVVAEADAHGHVRGYAANPRVDLATNSKGKLDVARAIGNGALHITKDLQLKELYRGMVPLVSGEIAEDFTYYFSQSEQVPSAVSLGVLVAPSHEIAASGGFIVQIMPGAPDDLIGDLEQRLQRLQSVSHMVNMRMSTEDIVRAVAGDYGVVLAGTVPLQFSCSCTRERYAQALIALGAPELTQMAREQETVELVCNFCTDRYYFTRDELKTLIDSAKQA